MKLVKLQANEAMKQICQNCKQEFTIEPEDFAFYERIDVPPPMWCPECRLIRRMCFRNERNLYRRQCNAPGHSEQLISVFSSDKPDTVYCHSAWWSDVWDPISFGQVYDFNTPFFTQLRALWKAVPDIALMNNKGENSEYCSITEGNKNCYLVVGGDFNEDSLYSTFIFNSKNCVDTHWASKSEYLYESSDCIQCYRLIYSRMCEECYESAFLYNCRNCHHCFMCTNLNNRSYCILNKQYEKREYENIVGQQTLSNYSVMEQQKVEFQAHHLRYPRRFARILHSVNSTGDNIQGGKNCIRSFEVFEGAEDSRYLWLIYSKIADCYDIDHSGLETELCYDSSTVYPGQNVLFTRVVRSCHNVLYSYNCHSSSYLFGCIGLRNKQYCILNKQYPKEEYETLLPRIKRQMDTLPYMDKAGREYRFGEFFPPEISPFCYNETVAQELMPLTEKEALEGGFAWKESEVYSYTPTVKSEAIPDDSRFIRDTITQEILECDHKALCAHRCPGAFRITERELEFYRAIHLPLPRLCPNCRHYKRIRERNPLRLWKRRCSCMNQEAYKNTIVHFHGNNLCQNEFETTYAPDRPEIVYCEGCYQAEVV